MNSVSQFSAPDVNAALEKWIEGLERPYKYGLTRDQVDAVKDALAANRQLHRQVNEVIETDDGELNLLSGMKNVWCVVAFAGKTQRKRVLLNIIATVQQTQKATPAVVTGGRRYKSK